MVWILRLREVPLRPMDLVSGQLVSIRSGGVGHHSTNLLNCHLFPPADLCYLHLMLETPDHPGGYKTGDQMGNYWFTAHNKNSCTYWIPNTCQALKQALCSVLQLTSKASSHAQLLQSCPTLFATLWTAACQVPLSMRFSRGSSRSRDQTWVSYISCIGRWVLYH